MEIPKRMFFIWLGNTLPDDYLKNIMRFVSSFSFNYEVELWVDNPNVLTKALYKSNFISLGVANLRVRNIKEILFHPTVDIEWRRIVEQELVGLYNYGAASDILRLLILQAYGGYYFDTDTIHMPNSLQANTQRLPEDPKKEFMTMMDNVDPYSTVPPSISNGAIASIPGHKILKTALDLIKRQYSICKNNPYVAIQGEDADDVQSYKNLKKTNNNKSQDYYYSWLDKKRNKKNLFYLNGTILMSGPKILHNAVLIYVFNDPDFRKLWGRNNLGPLPVENIEEFVKHAENGMGLDIRIQAALTRAKHTMLLPIPLRLYQTEYEISAQNKNVLFAEMHNSWFPPKGVRKFPSFEH